METHSNRITDNDMATTADDRRMFPRHGLLHRLILIVGKTRFDGYTYDISSGGLSFVAAGEIPFTQAEIQIPELQAFFSGNIIDAREKDPRGLRRYHMLFSKPLSDAEIGKIIAR